MFLNIQKVVSNKHRSVINGIEIICGHKGAGVTRGRRTETFSSSYHGEKSEQGEVEVRVRDQKCLQGNSWRVLRKDITVGPKRR